MKRAIYCALISAVVGFVVAAYLATHALSSGPSVLSTVVAYILCPPGVLAGITMTDPDAESVWLFFGPLNALIYGAVGFTLWLLIVGDGDDESAVSKGETGDRPLGL
jgi:hypothetical protein